MQFLQTKYFKFFLLFIGLVIITGVMHFSLAHNFKSGVAIINDNGERIVYFSRGEWFSQNKKPYSEVFSEYPQLATYSFGIVHGLTMLIYGAKYTQMDYFLVFSALMVLLLFMTIVLVYELLPSRKNLALLLLLPASIYFSYNRYDIFPALVSVISFGLLSRKKYNWAAFTLALGVLLKWYMLVIFPIYIVYYYSLNKKIPYKMIVIFGLTGLAGILSTVLYGGIDALLVPYTYHVSRSYNDENLFYILKVLFSKGLIINIANKGVYILFFLLQFSIAIVAFKSRIDSIEKAIKWTACSVMAFLLFAKFYSPQWILWVMPFLILLIRTKRDIIIIIAFDIITYLYYPIIFEYHQLISRITVLYHLIIILKTAILAYYFVVLFKEIKGDIQLQWFRKTKAVS